MYNFFVSIIGFSIIISIVVFIHEMGHFYVARKCGVQVETFAIGFGKTLWSITDKYNTQWKINILPLGGYVKMYGDATAVSNPDYDKLNTMSQESKQISFFYKKLWQKFLIVFAGPFMNYILALFVMIIILFAFGDRIASNTISDLEVNGPAAQAGIEKGDIIVQVNDQSIQDMQSVKIILAQLQDSTSIDIIVNRNGNLIKFVVQPILHNNIYRIGVLAKESIVQYTLIESVINSVERIYMLNLLMIHSLKQFILGEGSKEDLGGPIKIAQVSGIAMQHGIKSFLELLSMLSLNLGLMNLLPIPGLDGGHLMYYIVHTICGRPVNQKIQDIGMKIGFMLLICLLIFTTYNDILSLLK